MSDKSDLIVSLYQRGMSSHIKVIAAILFLFCFGFTVTGSAQSFKDTRNKAWKIYEGHELTFYCGCSYTRKGNRGILNLEACGYKVRKNVKRASKMEWEHVVPAWELGHKLPCWKEGTDMTDTNGRENCKKDSEFWSMYTNLHNLVPAIGEVNGDRSNFPFAILEEVSNYGECDVEIKYLGGQAFPRGKVEPPEGARGAIGRIYLYMLDKYKFDLDIEQQNLFRKWNELHAVTDWECERDRRIAKEQGEHNKFVKEKCPND